jgi:hypothetical protein
MTAQRARRNRPLDALEPSHKRAGRPMTAQRATPNRPLDAVEPSPDEPGGNQ